MPARCRHRRGTCRSCGRPLDQWQGCRRRTCPGYRDLWAGDWTHVLLENLGQLRGVGLVTITAPGTAEGAAWDPGVCCHPPGEKCSGTKGCRVVQPFIERWHQDHEKRASQLHRAVSSRLRRRFGGGPLVAAKAWEMSQRGLAHLHLVMPLESLRDRARADAYIASAKELGPRYWFGYADLRVRWTSEQSGRRSGAYVGKYVGKATSESLIAKRPVYVGRFLTARSGITMRFCRLRRFVHRLYKDGFLTLRRYVEVMFDPWALQSFRGLSPVPRGP